MILQLSFTPATLAKPDPGVPSDVHCATSGPASVLPSPDLRCHAPLAPEPNAGCQDSILPRRTRRRSVQESPDGPSGRDEHGGADERSENAQSADGAAADGRTGERERIRIWTMFSKTSL